MFGSISMQLVGWSPGREVALASAASAKSRRQILAPQDADEERFDAAMAGRAREPTWSSVVWWVAQARSPTCFPRPISTVSLAGSPGGPVPEKAARLEPCLMLSQPRFSLWRIHSDGQVRPYSLGFQG